METSPLLVTGSRFFTPLCLSSSTSSCTYLSFLCMPSLAPVQLHILSYSLHALLVEMSKQLASGDLDPCLPSITDIVAEDLFGHLAEEREVPEAISKLPEAKSSKGLATLEIVSSKLSPQLLPSLIAPLKKVGSLPHRLALRVGGGYAHCVVAFPCATPHVYNAADTSPCPSSPPHSTCPSALPQSLTPFHVLRLLKAVHRLSCLVKLRRPCAACHSVSRAMKGSPLSTFSCSFTVWCPTVPCSSPAVKGGEVEGRA